jgi:hypothetical protein
MEKPMLDSFGGARNARRREVGSVLPSSLATPQKTTLRNPSLIPPPFIRPPSQPVPDSMVKVFDLRYSLRPLFTLPAPAPVAVSWHPALPMSVMVASVDGSFTVADVSNPAASHNFQVGLALAF